MLCFFSVKCYDFSELPVLSATDLPSVGLSVQCTHTDILCIDITLFATTRCQQLQAEVTRLQARLVDSDHAQQQNKMLRLGHE